ncbi:MAG: hypothetical protein ABSF12_27180 [Bryobacteraceae bacterium]|jgi:hypothetical protein
MRQALSLILVSLLVSHLAPADTPTVREQIVSMSLGTNIELRLKNNDKLRGARGEVTDTGFTLVDPRFGNRQIAFADVAAVKLFVHQSHTTRNILIGVGIAVAAVGIWLGIELRCGVFGCGKHPL